LQTTNGDPNGAGRPRVRPARISDATSLGEFLRQSWREAGPGALGFTGANEDAVRQIASEEFLARRLASRNVKIVIAEREGRILGFASLGIGGPGKAELSGIVVLRSESGKGLGTRLLRKICDIAHRQGFARMTVKTETFNARAIGFYRKNGFVEMRRTTEKIGRSKVPLMLLGKTLR